MNKKLRGSTLAGRLLRAGSLLCLLASSQLAVAQQVLFIRAGHFLDVANGKMLRDRVIVVSGDRIDRIGSTDSIEIPEGEIGRAHV